MSRYIVRRILINIPVIWIIATAVFFASTVLPGDFVAQRLAGQISVGDPAQQQAQQQAIREDFGLDKPVIERYIIYLGELVRGDLGTSYRTGKPALEGFVDGLPYTVQLSVLTMIVGLVMSVPLGIMSAVKQDSFWDYGLRFFAISSVAAPSFWTATFLLFAVVRFDLWTVELIDQPLLWEDPIKSLQLFGLPAIAGGLLSGATIMRLLRSQMLEVLRQDYVRTAWSKGLRQRAIIMNHALKNAMIPVFTVIGITIATLISGNVVFELIFNIPGVGYRVLQAINQRDQPVVQAFVLVIATFVVFVNLMVDVAYGWFDPRIRYS